MQTDYKEIESIYEETKNDQKETKIADMHIYSFSVDVLLLWTVVEVGSLFHVCAQGVIVL